MSGTLTDELRPGTLRIVKQSRLVLYDGYENAGGRGTLSLCDYVIVDDGAVVMVVGEDKYNKYVIRVLYAGEILLSFCSVLLKDTKEME